MQQFDLFTRKETNNRAPVSRTRATAVDDYNRIVKLHGLRKNDWVHILVGRLHGKRFKGVRVGEMGFSLATDGVGCTFYWPDEGKTWERV